MSRRPLLLTIAPAAMAVLLGLLLFESGRPILMYRYPEVQPVFESEEGWNWERIESDNGYSWVFREDIWNGKERPRTGLGMAFLDEPGPAETPASIGRQPGRVGPHPVKWFLERHHVDGGPVRRAVFEYHHGPGYLLIGVHVWVWGQDDAQVAVLLRKLETVQFVNQESQE